MGIGTFLAIRAHESAREAEQLPEEEAFPARHGLATFLSFVAAGALPLLPFVGPLPSELRMFASTALTFTALFGVGAARASVTTSRWWLTGLEMLLLGILVAVAAYGAGALARSIIAS
jgi:VIT1/CCC1 family predicted Fe2+/Mn2+ transporter